MRVDPLPPSFPYQIRDAVFSGEAALPAGEGDFLLLFVRGGSALCRDGRGECLLRRGDILLQPGAAALSQARDFRGVLLRFRMNELVPPASGLRLAPGFRALFEEGVRRLIHPEADAWLPLESGLNDALAEYRRQLPGWQAFARGHLSALLIWLCRRYESAAAPAPSGAVARALSYLEDHCTEDIALPELARIAGVSPRHLDRAFRAECGLTPRAYMTRLRMARARVLLRSDRPITEIAFDCGYADSNYFSQVFRRHTGMSPQQYRRQSRGQERESGGALPRTRA